MRVEITSLLCIDVRSDDFENIVSMADRVVDQADTAKVVGEIEQKLTEDVIHELADIHIGTGPSESEPDPRVDDLLDFVDEMMKDVRLVNPINKLDILIRLIGDGQLQKTHEFHEIKETRFNVPNLLTPTSDIPRTDQPRKWLVFMVQNSSTAIVVQRLAEIGVFAVSATGTVDQIKNAINLYETSEIESVLVLSAEKSSAGLNLQQTTDVVFMQALTNVETIAQSIARAHRTGRTCNLNVHWIIYGHEYAYLFDKLPVANIQIGPQMAPARPPEPPRPAEPAPVRMREILAFGRGRANIPDPLPPREQLAEMIANIPPDMRLNVLDRLEEIRRRGDIHQ